MSKVGVGRGRGIYSANQEAVRTPLRKPNKFIEENLTKHLHRLKLSEAIREEILDVVSLIKNTVNTEDNLKIAVAKIYEYGLQSKRHAVLGAELCQDLSDYSVNEITFRKILLQKLQNDFTEREKLILNSRTFIGRVSFLCEVFNKVRICNTPIECLAFAVIEYFEMLLNGDISEITVLTEQIIKNGRDLELCAKEQLDNLFIKIRRRILDNSLNVSCCTLLLVSLELYLNKWEMLPDPVRATYAKIYPIADSMFNIEMP